MSAAGHGAGEASRRSGRARVVSRHAVLGGVRVHWIEAGRGTPLLLIHGLGNSSMVWRRVIPRLARHHSVVALDLPGFGHSEKTRRRPLLTAYTEVVVGVLDTVFRGVPAALVGNSVGGAVAMRVARERADLVSRVVLVDPAGVGRGVPTWWRLAAVERPVRLLALPILHLAPRRLVEAAVGEAYRRIAFSERENATDRSVRLFAQRLATPERLAHFLEAAHDIVAGFAAEVQAVGRPLEMPILAVWGRHDRLVPLATAPALLERLGGVELRIVENAGHSPQLEQPAAFLDAVGGFLHGVTERPRRTRVDATEPQRR